MPEVNDVLEAHTRAGRGKGASHKTRASGQLPATAYGPSTDQRFLTLNPKNFWLQRVKYGLAHIYDVNIDGKKGFKALIREVQQNPLTQELEHIDLYALDMNKPIRVEVVVDLEGKPAGVVDGGILQQVMRKVLVLCLPLEIPKRLTCDVTHLKIGQSVHMSEVKLPKGVKFVSQVDEALATMIAPPEEEVAATPAVAGVEGAVAGAVPGAEGAAAGAAPGATPAAAGGKDAKGAAPAAAGGKDAKGAAPAKGGGKEGGDKGKK